MANKSKPKFNLRQRVRSPHVDAWGIIVSCTISTTHEPAYQISHETTVAGIIPPAWCSETSLLLANPPLPKAGLSFATELREVVEAAQAAGAFNPKARKQLRARRKSKR